MLPQPTRKPARPIRSLLEILLIAALVASPLLTSAQSAPPANAGDPCRLSALQICAKDVLQDEAGIIASPLRAPKVELLWLIPFGAATGIAVHEDTRAIDDLGVHPARENDFNKFSDYGGLYLPVAGAGIGYIAGSMRHDDYLTETAVLSAEAMADATILDQGLKYALDRENPMLDNARGGLWPHGPKDWPNSPSMPSEHAMNIWAFAHVVADQYNGIATNLVVYSLATGVSASRVLARQHFPSDVIVGSTLGWLAGGYVLHHRSNEHGYLARIAPASIAPAQTPLGRGLELRFNLARGE